MIYYTADLHLHYAPLLAGRPFATVAEMDEALINNWNDVVTEADTVYLVGDVGYNGGYGAAGRPAAAQGAQATSSAATTTPA